MVFKFEIVYELLVAEVKEGMEIILRDLYENTFKYNSHFKKAVMEAFDNLFFKKGYYYYVL